MRVPTLEVTLFVIFDEQEQVEQALLLTGWATTQGHDSADLDHPHQGRHCYRLMEVSLKFVAVTHVMGVPDVSHCFLEKFWWLQPTLPPSELPRSGSVITTETVITAQTIGS